MDLAAYRRSAEAFNSRLTAEYYRHFSGLSESYEIGPIYGAHAELFTEGAIQGLRAELDRAPAGSEAQQRLTMLLEFAQEGFVGQATEREEATLANREAGLLLELSDRQVGFRASAVLQANEPDPGRREEIEQARMQALSRELGPLYEAIAQRRRAAAGELGYSSYLQMCSATRLFDLQTLGEQTAAFLAATDAAYEPVVDPQLRQTLGYGFAELRRSDLPRFFRAPEADGLFPGARLVPSLIATLHGMGIDVQAQPSVILDLEPRPRKSPRAFCAPVRAPGEVYLVVAPAGGRDDYSALFHEAGHTEHYAHVDANLAFEFRMLGDNAITECFAFLLQHLTESPAWLARHLGVEDGCELAAHARAHRLVYLRRYAAKLAYELELHAEQRPLAELSGRYGELLGDALRVPWPAEMFLADVDPGFYCACYLRAWALETHVRRYLVERFGAVWFDSPQAGRALVKLWREGQRGTPEELLERLTGEPLRFEVLLDDLDLAASPER
ncbi:MAG: hypothetical protein ACYC91_06285 [Solirubrobacteraceae bacterium]